jgi:hypothetical protein
MIITEEVLLEVAAKVLDYPASRRWKESTDRTKFPKFFGCSIEVATNLWNRIESTLKQRSLPKHLLLWTLSFLKTYGTEEVNCRLMGWPDPKTYREWVWYMLEQICRIKDDVINLDNRFAGTDFNNPPKMNCYISVDGTDCPINEPWPFRPIWYSQKFNGPAVKYEVGVCIQTHRL